MEGQAEFIGEFDRHAQGPVAGARLKRALAAFGLTLRSVGSAEAGDRPAMDRAAAELDHRLRHGGIALVTGPSGAGKSSLLAALARRAQGAGERVVHARALPGPGDDRAMVELFVAPPEGDAGSLRLLAGVGLGDAVLFPRPARSLSDGQRARLGIALAFDAALAQTSHRRPVLVLVDELGGGLDDLTALGVSTGIRRCVDRAAERRSIRVVCATPRHDLECALGPDMLLRIDAAGRAGFAALDAPPAQQMPRIEAGTLADYHPLARWHYRAGPPAVPRRVLRAVHERAGVVGVLMTAMPTLNARWRSIVWPDRYEGLAPRERARRLNDELRCIARVIVDPRVRATGVATALVRAYLSDPETPGTEAVAAMGAACPFFARAGMREYALPPAPADARLLDALERAGLEPDDLVDVDAAAARVGACPLAVRELRLWAGASRATRGAAGTSPRRGLSELIGLAARRVGCRPRVYAAVIGRGETR